ncbi:MAG: hypothetical protein COA42_15570 [Alteromonadaceae bacterium]|nr:MAG: hypothetical protein COA42_15570 [Alteromonadaceae bacterium]
MSVTIQISDKNYQTLIETYMHGIGSLNHAQHEQLLLTIENIIDSADETEHVVKKQKFNSPTGVVIRPTQWR